MGKVILLCTGIILNIIVVCIAIRGFIEARKRK